MLGVINTVYPEADHQRCWIHKMRNVFVYFPKRPHVEVKRLLRQMYDATTREQVETLMAQFAEVYGRDYPRAVECLLKDRDDLLTYNRYPQEHWVSLKTTNQIESIFATVKLRTNAARWLNAPYLMTKILEGVKFEDGIEVRKTKNNQTEKRAA